MRELLPLAIEFIKLSTPDDLQSSSLDAMLALFEPINQYYENRKKERLYRLLKNVFEHGGSMQALKDTSNENKDRTQVFEDLIQVCMEDSDSEKTPHYSQLAVAILSGLIEKKIYRKHLLLSLKQLSFLELEILKKSYIAKNFSVISEASYKPLSVTESLRNAQREALGDVHIKNLQQLGLITDERLTEIGILFVESIYKRDDLEPSSVSWKIWQKGTLAVATSNHKLPNQDQIIEKFKELRIQCEEVSVNDIINDTSIAKGYKAILFPNNYKKLIHSEQSRLTKFSEANSYKCIVLPQSSIPYPFFCKNIKFQTNSDIDTQCKQIAESLGYLLPDFSD